MSARKLRTSAADAGQPLGAWLAARLGLAVDEARARLAAGGVYVDGARERDPDRALASGQRITVYDAVAADGAPGWRVVHEDADVVVVDKPAGLPVASGRAGGRALDAEVIARYPGARLFHRIDRETSGLVLFTRRREARQRLAGDLARGQILRRYAAVVTGAPPASIILDAPIGPDPADRLRMRAGGPGASGGRPARTFVLFRQGAAGGRVVLEIRLDTGVTHQIRAHLAGAGWPIVGDTLYGGEPARRMALHADRLAWPGGEATSELDLLALL